MSKESGGNLAFTSDVKSSLRDKIAAALRTAPPLADDLTLAAAVIRELASDCIYRYSCANCGDFWFDTSARMQRFALLHNRSHLAVIQETKQCEKVSKADE